MFLFTLHLFVQLVTVLKLVTGAAVSRTMTNIHVGCMVESAFVMLSAIRRVVAVMISRLLAAVQVSNTCLIIRTSNKRCRDSRTAKMLGRDDSIKQFSSYVTHYRHLFYEKTMCGGFVY